VRRMTSPMPFLALVGIQGRRGGGLSPLPWAAGSQRFFDGAPFLDGVFLRCAISARWSSSADFTPSSSAGRSNSCSVCPRARMKPAFGEPFLLASSSWPNVATSAPPFPVISRDFHGRSSHQVLEIDQFDTVGRCDRAVVAAS
jgi:hypothetical protein